jgi:hypothetical protein
LNILVKEALTVHFSWRGSFKETVHKVIGKGGEMNKEKKENGNL